MDVDDYIENNPIKKDNCEPYSFYNKDLDLLEVYWNCNVAGYVEPTTNPEILLIKSFENKETIGVKILNLKNFK